MPTYEMLLELGFHDEILDIIGGSEEDLYNFCEDVDSFEYERDCYSF